jgi:hypothetical protein
MKRITTLIFVVCAFLGAFAQSDLTLYNFSSIPQALNVNPAARTSAKVWIGLPVVSGTHFHYHNNGFALIDLFETGTDPDENRNRIIESLDENSQFTINQSYDLFSLGIKMGKGFVTLGAEQVVDFRMDYPADILRLFNFGNASGAANEPLDEVFSLSTFDLESEVRTNAYLGYQRTFMDDRLSVGARFKYIIGQQSTFVERINANIITNDTALIVSSDVLVRTSGSASLIDGGADLDPLALALPENSGIGFDFGVGYQLNDHWNVSASVVDLGYVDWTSNNRNYVSQGEFTFTGVDVDFSDENPGQGSEYLVDSLVAAFDFQEEDGVAYRKSLNTRIFASANYKFNSKHQIGVLFHTRKWGDEFFNDYSVNYRSRLARNFEYSISYSIINGTYQNFGAGFSAKLGPLQLYLISDNVFGAIAYETLQSTNLRLGLNIVFFGRKNKNKATEEPEGIRLVEPGS